MPEYCLIESRDPFDCSDVDFTYELAVNLARQGNKVTLFLVQNGVLPVRRAADTQLAATASTRGVTVLADDFSLKERGVRNGEMLDTVTPAPLETVVDALARGVKTVWH